ncbi:hypothetical protein GCM10010116_26350 [Microbispora rosea subsp. aerata]|nr:hypothetical protein [Microbispora rosea]GGO13083.1 hypothetical protein GCM10010116_26350 [Microbispora rosea subsp. aerata]GIH58443.1 hypothetical protein Mro02_53570 [Microbispora rosea subsp. aerata]GLJ85171.1 hypothetical protein GCM10017588_38990 [Microbispora rosea subsp. aerata]
MGDEIELISDGDGLTVIGSPKAVDRFLASEGLSAKDLPLDRLKSTIRTAAEAAQTGSEIVSKTGRWVKLTEQSAEALKKYKLMKGPNSDVSRAVLTENGKIKGLLQLATPGSLLANPALLAGVAGLMAQLAMRDAMEEITDYLAAIDKKVDDVLRGQKDAVLADMIGAGLVIDEAMTAREQVGRVSEITWSKVQATSMTIARTQAYALRQLDALAEKLESTTNIGDLAKVSKDAESAVREWLAVLARCFQLQDAVAVLELDRVLDASPEELDRHRIALKTARQNRMELISQSTERLMARITAAVATANKKVLLHPTASPAVVHSSNNVTVAVADFQKRLGIEGGRQLMEARRWTDAATEVKDKALETGAEGLNAAMRIGNETVDIAKSVTEKLSSGIAEQVLRLRGNKEG